MQRNKVKSILRLVKNNQIDIADAEILLVHTFFETNHTKASTEKIKHDPIEMFM